MQSQKNWQEKTIFLNIVLSLKTLEKLDMKAALIGYFLAT